jgi:hypothetical protein
MHETIFNNNLTSFEENQQLHFVTSTEGKLQFQHNLVDLQPHYRSLDYLPS